MYARARTDAYSHTQTQSHVWWVEGFPTECALRCIILYYYTYAASKKDLLLFWSRGPIVGVQQCYTCCPARWRSATAATAMKQVNAAAITYGCTIVGLLQRFGVTAALVIAATCAPVLQVHGQATETTIARAGETGAKRVGVFGSDYWDYSLNCVGDPVSSEREKAGWQNETVLRGGVDGRDYEGGAVTAAALAANSGNTKCFIGWLGPVCFVCLVLIFTGAYVCCCAQFGEDSMTGNTDNTVNSTLAAHGNNNTDNSTLDAHTYHGAEEAPLPPPPPPYYAVTVAVGDETGAIGADHGADVNCMVPTHPHTLLGRQESDLGLQDTADVAGASKAPGYLAFSAGNANTFAGEATRSGAEYDVIVQPTASLQPTASAGFTETIFI